MTVYADLVMLLNFLVDYLLLVGTNRLCGFPTGWRSAALAAAIGGVYSGLCLFPGLSFLGNILWRLVCLAAMCIVAFGMTKNALRRGTVFLLLSMALGGVAVLINREGVWSLLLASLGVCVMCLVGFRDRVGGVSYIPVELHYGGKRVLLTALQDTGNTLVDPVTGRPVLVVDAQTAQQLTGLSRQQLRSPVDSIASAPLPGLRLIPYHGVGQTGGMLLAVRMQDVRIGKWRGSSLVAFAPEGLSREGAYQALTGGAA